MATSARSSRAPDDAFHRAVHQHLGGNTAAAERLYRQALHANPRHAPAANNLGTLLATVGNRSEAETLFRQATRLQPDYGEALNNLGILLAGGGAHDEACRCFDRATVLEPGKAGWHNNHANTLVELFRFRDAVAAYDRAIAIDATNADYWSNRGIALRGLRENDEAIRSLEHATRIDPRHLNALSNLGVLYKESRRFDDARQTFERALSIDPENPAILTNFASVFERQGEYDQVRVLAMRARDADPAYPEAYNLLANAEMESGRYDDAERLYETAVSLDAQNRNANWNLALIWLLRGEFARGWRQFEWRKRLQSVVFDHGDYGPNHWTGDSLEGKTVLLHSEQGIGDAIQFIRYAPLLKERGAARIIVEAPYPIVPLLAGAIGVDSAVARGAPLPHFDVHTNLMSLPGLVGTTLETIPATVPYLRAEPRTPTSIVAARPDALKVGIVWAGNPVHARDFLRSAPLAAFTALAQTPGTAFFSLQKGEGPERELRELRDPSITDLAPHLTDFRDTAAAIEALDLVIAVDTSVAHLAGSLGKATWLLLPHVPDFRWMLDRTDSPWYPTMRLFRQPALRDWDGVFAHVTQALREMAGGRPAVEPVGRAVASDIVTIPSATRTDDGRPRFDVWVPLADLSDPNTFAEYEAELIGGGAHLATRAFLRELLQPGDMYIEGVPGLGLVAMEAVLAPAAPREVRVIGDDGTQERLRSMVSIRNPGVQVTGATSITAALSGRSGQRRIVRLGSHDARGLDSGASLPDVIVWEGVAPARVPFLERLERSQFANLSLSLIDGEAALDPIAAPEDVQVVVSLAPHVLAALTATPIDHEDSTVARRTLGIDWELRSDTGWGVYGINLTLDLLRRGTTEPAVLGAGVLDVSPLVAARLTTVVSAAARRTAGEFGGVMLRALGNNFSHGPLWSMRARRNAGVIFFEDTAFDAQALARAASLDLVVAGSSWNASVMQARGIARVVTVPQGIDPSIFHPAPRAGLFGDRFVIFSGGKLEYRKGQDLVAAAFRAFVRRHSDALLIVAWHNAWPTLISDLDLAGHVFGQPGLREGQLDVAPWLVANGIPAHSVIDIGRQPNALMGQLVREADVALFPNRCEGGTNLVAMECMAAGVPTIVSANTGHLDLVATGGCLPLTRQAPSPHPTRFFQEVDGWGESDVDEILEHLELAYTDRAHMQSIAARGADAMSRMTWSHQVGKLLDALQPLW
ncbi:MAG: tetratricopeptide repeat protein [Gemmatimonadaceae bacterium]